MVDAASLFLGARTVAGVADRPAKPASEPSVAALPAAHTVTADTVTVSQGAQDAAAVGAAVEQAARPLPAAQRNEITRKFPEPLTIDLGEMMAKAEERIGALMDELGISRKAGLTVRSDNAGVITVEGDHPKAKELEAAINADFEARNAVIGAHTLSTISRIAAAMDRAMKAAEANPGGADAYYAWVRNVAATTMAMDFRLGFGAEGFAGTFIDATNREVALTEGLRLSLGSA